MPSKLRQFRRPSLPQPHRKQVSQQQRWQQGPLCCTEMTEGVRRGGFLLSGSAMAVGEMDRDRVMGGNCPWSGLSGFLEDVTPPCVAPSRVSSRGVSEVDTVPCQLHRSASELRGCPTSRNSSYTGREVVLRGLGFQSWAYWAGMNSAPV
ncbi:hypothetical protein PIB30_077653 [Stylosanthes scabra]|uniref:Uncharacterized protein n=1 Tax=Stylosanthes scabra TaxID=79078 RepID=A0ABU6RRC9_9FABA|nr:hypothetical protein [Stylosanthes scabra]